MAAKKTQSLYFFFAILAILSVIYSIVRRETDSSLVDAIGWISKKVEGFDTAATTAIKCPSGMKFFVDARGISFCCGGTVNPYGATCSDPAKLCALVPNVPDHRGPAHGFVPVCRGR